METQNTRLIPAQADKAYRILVISGQGDAGKTTLSTNLAAWLAYRDQATALLDTDPQGAASAWVAQRSAKLPQVYGFKPGSHHRTPATQWLITEATTGIAAAGLDALVQQHHLILVPVVPRDSDIRSDAGFIGELLLTPTMRHQRRPLAVIANRLKPNNQAWERLQRFLNSLNIPYPTVLRESQNYPRAYREGQGVVDYQQQAYLRDRADWEALIQWLDTQYADHEQHKNPAPAETTLVDMV